MSDLLSVGFWGASRTRVGYYVRPRRRVLQRIGAGSLPARPVGKAWMLSRSDLAAAPTV